MATRRRTKIVATLGPACSDPGVLKRMIEAGMDCARVNFSHGTLADHRRAIEAARAAADAVGKPVAIIQDIQGPKIRVGELPHGRTFLREGEEVSLSPHGGSSSIPVDYEGFARDVAPGARILLDDGLLELLALRVEDDRVVARVVHGGELKSHKGVNLPGTTIRLPSVTAKDRADVQAGARLDVDYVAASFVRSPQDIADVRSLLMREELPIRVIAKIETQEALDNLEPILRASDGALVARGDLGVELPPERVPVAQKEIVACANLLGAPVVTATQMLESMIERPRPTRAEASDVANAIFDGTDAVMLSGETAVGKHPVETVATMSRIVESAEAAAARYHAPRPDPPRISVADAIAHATVFAARDVQAKAIVCLTNSGTTARLVAKHRPHAPILAVTPLARTLRQLSLVWGVVPLPVARTHTEEELLEKAAGVAKTTGLVGKGDVVVVTSGRLGVTATTSHLRVAIVE
ncbi:MAG TPA: pyruvate kinase [Candidatus Thermoplasmatota archaeon]|nr:pyruvate kinase [Candidatus Thermoplasmatota archaeon]